MTSIRSHHDLIVWQKAMDLAEEVYRLSRAFPRSEQYALTSQITRAVVSVAANIAEGRARSTARDYANFLSIAMGSLAETETYLILAVRLGYLSNEQIEDAQELLDHVGRMLTSLRQRLSPRTASPKTENRTPRT